MFISTKVVIDIATGTVLHREGFEYSGPLAECKGDQALKDQEMSQAGFTKKLQAAFSTQFKNQQDLLGFLNPKLESMISNPTGLDQSTKTALNSSAIENNAVAYQNATKAQQAQAAARGDGSSLPSGVQEQVQGELAGQAAGQKSSALNQIQLEDANLKNANQWKAISALSGDAELANPNSFASSANQGSSVVGSLGSEYNSTQNNSFWSQLGSSVAGGVGKGLSTLPAVFG